MTKSKVIIIQTLFYPDAITIKNYPNETLSPVFDEDPILALHVN